MHLIQVQKTEDTGRVKNYSVNTQHPLYSSLRGIILKYVGIDQILEQIIQKLGNIEKVYLTGDLAQGKNSSFVDLVLVGNIDRQYLNKLIEKVEPLIDKKIRVALFAGNEFTEKHLNEMGVIIDLMSV